MKIRSYGLILTCLLLVLGSVLGYIQVKDPAVKISLLTRTNNQIYDGFFKNKKNDDSYLNKSDSVLIAIDEESVQELGRWPWSREVINQITINALASGIKTIGFDIIFSESENEKVDAKFAKTVEQNNSKIVLGTFGNENITNSLAYQDYCYTEAFLFNKGHDIISVLDQKVVTDDNDDSLSEKQLEENNQFEQLDFSSSLNKKFNIIKDSIKDDYKKEMRIKDLNTISSYQENRLNTLVNYAVYNYCSSWLTRSDQFLIDNITSASQILEGIDKYKNLSELDRISAFKKDIPNLLIRHYSSWIPNTEVIQKSAIYTASFNSEPDMADGVVRNYPLVYRAGNRTNTSYIPSLALQSFLTANNYQAYFKLEKIKDTKAIGYLNIISIDSQKVLHSVPLDENGLIKVNYYGSTNSLPYISARDLYNNPEKINVKMNGKPFEVKRLDYLKNKTAIFGATATAIYDLRNTPVNVNFPGPEMHLSVLENFFKNNFMQTSENDFLFYTIGLLVAVILLTIMFLYSNLLVASSLFAILNIIIYFVAEYYFKQNIQFTLLSTLFLNTAITYFLYLVYIYFFETRKSQEIKNTFSKYVSKEIVNEILKNQDNLQLKGQKLNMTVFFSDIRSFTDFSEKMDPQELSLLLNKYLTPMSEAIFETQGTIDKFMGDAIMALFGAPINYPDHPQKACKAALKCLSHLGKLNTDFAKRGWPEIKIGIGLNTGYMVAGNIGSDQIQSYTVIGDEVNLASRLEGLTKNYDAKILISESTYNAVKNEYVAQEADLVRVKGKTKPVRIYVLLDEKDQFKDFSFLERYHVALKLFQDKNFTQARLEFETLLKEKPSDNFLCELYLKRSTELINEPPLSSWDGVCEYKTK